MNIGDKGLAEFTYTKKGFKGYIKAHGKIIDIDGGYLIFEDSDGFIYLVSKKKFMWVEK